MIDVGGVSHTVHVLTGAPGQWTRVRPPNPPDPGDLGGAYGPEVLRFNTIVPLVFRDVRHQGTLRSVYAGAVTVGPWIAGECGEEIEVKGFATGKFGFGVSYFGFSFGAEVQKSVSFTRTKGGETSRRYRARAVAPAVDWFDDRNWDERSVTIGTLGQWQQYDHTQGVPMGRSYLAGEDVIIDAACCEE